MKCQRLLVLSALLSLVLTGCGGGGDTPPFFNSSNNSFDNSSNTSNSNYSGKSTIIDDERFELDFNNKDEARENGNRVTETICEEGMVLLKNEMNAHGNYALPLASGAKVSVFGKNSVNLVYGGSGSSAASDRQTYKTIYDSLIEQGYAYNPVLKEFYDDSKQSGKGRSNNPIYDSEVMIIQTGETPISSYTNALTDSYASYCDAALVVISRISGENFDLPRVASDDSRRHYLELDNNERDLLRHIGQSGQFDRVILLLNTSNPLDLGFLMERTNPTEYNDFGKYIDAALMIGYPGANGIMALGKIISGEVNPSGRTIDTYYTDFDNDPTYQNFGDNLRTYGNIYLDSSARKTNYYTVEYEENNYIGYRYYETRAYTDGEDWYSSNVVFPFGYGLSYTTFEQSVVNSYPLSSPFSPNERFEVRVRVTNTGSIAGKDVVQIYAETPYRIGGIEKPSRTLVGFAKTKTLQPTETETLSIVINPYDFASFDSRDMNLNGFKGWELDAGNYVFHLSKNAHQDCGSFIRTLNENFRFEQDPVTGNDVKPLFDEVTEQVHERNLSRDNFASTFPQTITDEERTISDEFLKKLKSKETTNDEVYTELPTMGADIRVKFEELINKDYVDPLWSAFLDQLTFEEMLRLFNEGCYSTTVIARKNANVTEIDEQTGQEKIVTKDNYVLVPATTSADGPAGFVSFLGDPAVYGCCYYCSECLVAQTFNTELAHLQGTAIGNESLIGNEKNGGVPYTGLYAPNVNIHRSPFGGRNFERYSEDPFVSGKMAASFIKGAQDKGVYTNIKNFALNEQETNRNSNGLATWCDEQAMREIYLKPFEISVKEGRTYGLMTSFNRIGTEWTGGSYRLLTIILRKEWGFQGSVISDFHVSEYMNSKQMLYAGGDLNMASTNDMKLNSSDVSENNPKDVVLLRRAAHNNLFAIVNSNATAKRRER